MTNKKPLSFRFTLLATFLGNTFEWFDHAIFGFLVPIISKLFFPADHPGLTLIYGMLAFAFGSTLRPFGGLIFGVLGDRYGRRIILMISVLSMTFPMLVLSFLPTYWQIGIAAPIILLAMRLIQGLSAGGEFPGVATYLYEYSPANKREFYTSFVFFGIICGLFLGGTDFFFLRGHLTEQQFDSWGWRTVFSVGALLGLVTFFLRRKLHETPVFHKMRENHEVLRDPLKILVKEYKKPLFQLAGMEVLETVGYNLVIPFSVIYLTEFIHLSYNESLSLGLFRLVVLMLIIPLSGLAATKIGAIKQAKWAAWAFLIFTLPCYWLVQFNDSRFIGVLGLAALLGFYMGPLATVYCGLFPAKVRFSGVGIAFNVTIALVGSFIPLATFALIRKTGHNLMPAYLLMVSAVIALLSLRGVKSHSGESH